MVGGGCSGLDNSNLACIFGLSTEVTDEISTCNIVSAVEHHRVCANG
jgi:hypothetical protein